jgi:hypothetical protein
MNMHTTELLVPEPSLVEVEIAFRKLRYKSPGTDQILAKLIKTGGETIISDIYKFICSIWNKEELPQQREASIIPIYEKGDKTNCNKLSRNLPLIYCLQNFIQHSSGQVNSICQLNYQCGFRCNSYITNQIFCIWQILEKKWEYI